MASGVKVTEETQKEIKTLQLRHTYRFMIFKIANGKIQIEEYGQLNKTFDDLANCLRAASCQKEGRYALFDTPDTGKLVCMMWSPDTLPIKAKMLYSSSYDSLKKSTSAQVFLELHDDDDLCYEEIEKKIKAKSYSV